jgi:hypothetical protein
MSFFRFLRISVLLTVLVIVAGGQWLTRSRLSSWEKPVWMTIYPVVVQSGGNIGSYVDSLTADAFKDIGKFLAQQSSRYGRALQTPLKLQFAKPLYELPPLVPAKGNRLEIAMWSLKMRWWSWRRDREDGLPSPDVQMFVVYHQASERRLRERSVGVQKGMYGIVNAYASRAQASRNRVIIAHELLHILGATDKYDVKTGRPIEPEGLAEPGLTPRYPQKKAEIMGGRIALSASQAVMPVSLAACVIGTVTAKEIGWL